VGAAAHLGIRLRDYDALIGTFIPRYDEMLDAAAAALKALHRRAPVVLDLGIGSGALAARCSATVPGARFVGVDNDEGMLALARKRLGTRLTALPGDFLSTPFPPCDVVTASFALHHVTTRRRKGALYARCFEALRPGGMLVNADCCTASNPQLKAQDRAAWRTHLQQRYSTPRSEGFLRAWAKEDVYFRLEDEIDLLHAAGFVVDVPWRRDCFAVIVGAKRSARRHAS
jgi:ubiquinone/menaquinone biosynthesis C-methylase UbiE